MASLGPRYRGAGVAAVLARGCNKHARARKRIVDLIIIPSPEVFGNAKLFEI